VEAATCCLVHRLGFFVSGSRSWRGEAMPIVSGLVFFSRGKAVEGPPGASAGA
jgi:hypothetical protein